MNLKKIPTGVWMLGLVSLFTDIASELIHSILPLYMMTDLQASMTTIGFVEGVAAAAMLFAKIISGTLSDYIGKRKLLTGIGYGIAALSKLLFPLAQSINLIFFAHVMDRLGKGIRGAPRDALVAELAPPESRGISFGLRQALDTTGAFIGPLLAALLLLLTSSHLRTIMWIAFIPAAISVLLLVFGVKEPTNPRPVSGNDTAVRPKILSAISNFPRTYWLILTISTILSLGRFSEAFLILKSQSIQLPLAAIPFIFMIMNAVYALSATPAGNLSDRIDRKYVLAIGIGFLALADIALAFAHHVAGLIIGIIFWGLHMGFSEGIFAAMITDIIPDSHRGTAFGVFYFACGLALLCSSVAGGILWDNLGPTYLFLGSTVFAVLALMSVLLLHRSVSSTMIFERVKKG